MLLLVMLLLVAHKPWQTWKRNSERRSLRAPVEVPVCEGHVPHCDWQ